MDKILNFKIDQGNNTYSTASTYDLNTIISRGDTIEELKQNLEEAVELAYDDHGLLSFKEIIHIEAEGVLRVYMNNADSQHTDT